MPSTKYAEQAHSDVHEATKGGGGGGGGRGGTQRQARVLDNV